MGKQISTQFSVLVRKQPLFSSGEILDRLITEHGDGSLDLLQAVIAEHLLPKDIACSLWGESLGIAWVDPITSLISEEALDKLPAEIARKVQGIPIYVIDNVVTIAMADPTDSEMIRRVSQIAQCPISAVFSLPTDIHDAVSIHYATEKGLEESLAELAKSMVVLHEDLGAEELSALSESAGVIEIVDSMIFYALRERATDIHIEPHEQFTRVRFRIDGFLREVLTFARKLHAPIATRIKIISLLNISETRQPQDGRFSVNVGSNKANFRVSVIPSQYGEKVVVRVLNITGKRDVMTLGKSMMSQTVLRPLRRLIQSPNGILFVTGPTGSGKTTTLYSALHEINTPDINISTIEDPIEIQLAGVNQTQINHQIELDFAAMLRALLRQDPDVILLGEVRDLETAKIATEAALTGHLVLATLHTNSAPQAIVRLIDMGVEPYMVAPTLIGVLAQRLVGRICEKCKESYLPEKKVILKYFEDDGLKNVPFYRGKGCPACRHTGYNGRIAFHELVVMTEEMRTLISERKSVAAMVEAAKKAGYRPLRYDGLKKVLLGLTTIEQIEEHSSLEWAQ
ncbi:MAG TPA: GspE/PulE family protein [Opitutaceae bacterium]|nr:GspE/PulE family protein [Opitutaceae bacterium]